MNMYCVTVTLPPMLEIHAKKRACQRFLVLASTWEEARSKLQKAEGKPTWEEATISIERWPDIHNLGTTLV